jgi:catechol 2,3-dioxygenase-like lactoylglutathione lyase family enzyme
VAQLQRITPRLPVADLQRTIAFYTQTLEFQVGVLWPEDEPTFCILDRDRVSVGFFVPDGEHRTGTPGGGDLYIDVQDVRALHSVLKDKTEIAWGPEVYTYGRREFAVKDPDGYWVIFTERTNDPPTCAEP